MAGAVAPDLPPGPDTGAFQLVLDAIVRAPGGTGCLPQPPDLPPGDTVRNAVDRALSGLRDLEARLRRTEQALADAAPERLDALLDRRFTGRRVRLRAGRIDG